MRVWERKVGSVWHTALCFSELTFTPVSKFLLLELEGKRTVEAGGEQRVLLDIIPIL